MVSISELAWAAGFFDGEGTAYLCYPTNKKKTKSYLTMRLKCTQAGPYAVEILERFKEAVGNIGHIYGPHKSKNHKHQDIYQWDVSKFEDCQIVYSQLWKFLCGYKKSQITRTAKEVINYHQNKPPHGNCKNV